jgi:hypothetical protein
LWDDDATVDEDGDEKRHGIWMRRLTGKDEDSTPINFNEAHTPNGEFEHATFSFLALVSRSSPSFCSSSLSLSP